MPRASVWSIRLAMVYLLLGFTLGSLLLVHKGVNLSPAMWILLPVHVDFLLVGWAFQLAFGVAYWILPRFGRGPARGNPYLPWIAIVLMNAGLLVASGPVFGGSEWMLALGRLFEFSGSVTALLVLWRRVKPLQK